jgi:hypothetical protein
MRPAVAQSPTTATYQGFRVHQRHRTNLALALIVEQGIARDLLYGSVLAWKFMAAHGVPDEIIARVLAHPEERRPGDTPANYVHVSVGEAAS